MDVKQKLSAWFQWYLVNQDSLVELYDGKILVIKDFAVVGVFDNVSDAHFVSEERYGLGNFLIQSCSPGDDAYTVHVNRCY